MKTRYMILWVFFLASLFFVTNAYCDQWLVCDPAIPVGQVTHVRVGLNGDVLPDIPYVLGTTGDATGKVLIYNTSTLDAGSHTFDSIQFVNVRGPGPASSFSLPGLPGSCFGLTIASD